MTRAVSCRTAAGVALAGLVALLATGCATGKAPGRPAATGAEARPPAPSPAPVTVTPARFDAYLLAMRNIRAAHPSFLAIGANEAAVREEMREAVGRAGLRLEEFRDIHRQVQADPALRAEAESRLSGAGPAAGPVPAPSP
jgi:hypothetical protein